MSALTSVIDWTSELPLWQADAIRKFLTQESLSQRDIDDLYFAFKIEENLVQGPINKLSRPTKENISGANTDASSISLASITCVQNVNVIPDGTKMPFGHSGATLIYGENGVGKSGFARTLKRACNARDKTEVLLGNAYSPDYARPVIVTFNVVSDSTPRVIEWRDGLIADSDLSKITVFDAKCARVILDKKNEFLYKPYGLQSLEMLAELNQKFKERLLAEKPATEKQKIQDLKDGTKAKLFYDTISKSTQSSEINKNCEWTEENSKRYEILREWYAEHSKNGYDGKISNLKSVIRRNLDLFKSLRSVNRDFCKVVSEYVVIQKEYNASRIALEQANELLTNSSFPLQGIMSDPWKVLFGAAAEFSTKSAYPGISFPNLSEDSVCVLCMQEISEPAKQRFRKFSEFINSRVNSSHEICKTKLKSLRDRISKLNWKQEDELLVLAAEYIARNPESASAIVSASNNLLRSITKLKQVAVDGYEFSHDPISLTFNRSVATWIREKRKELRELVALANPSEYENLMAEGKELRSRKALNQKHLEISSYVAALVDADKIQIASNALDTKKITAKSKEIINATSTPELQLAMQSELKYLDCDRINVKLKPSGSAGQVAHGMELTGVELKTTVSSVLSEGEQKAVSIAGFFAELTLMSNRNPIVFDDPVTSIDHVFRSKIAERIASESLKRQVIVFTHDISFLFDLERKLDAIDGANKQVVIIKRKNNLPGCVIHDLPWHVMKSKERLTHLDTEIPILTKIFEEDQDEYDREASYWYSKLRETWETIVEENLLNNTIQRFGHAVKTLSLKGIEITDADYSTIEYNMSKASEWMAGHDKPRDISSHRPTPKELSKDVEAARSFIKAVGKRREQTTLKRDEYLTAQRSTQFG